MSYQQVDVVKQESSFFHLHSAALIGFWTRFILSIVGGALGPDARDWHWMLKDVKNCC
jgi:hypothetical protein